MNRFGDSIMSEIDLFTYSVIDIHRKYPERPNNDMDVYQVNLRWSWNGFTGYGDICFYMSTGELCNVLCENDSTLTIASDSRRQQPNGRSSCSLYNDPSMVPLLDMILTKSDLIPKKEYGTL